MSKVIDIALVILMLAMAGSSLYGAWLSAVELWRQMSG